MPESTMHLEKTLYLLLEALGILIYKRQCNFLPTRICFIYFCWLALVKALFQGIQEKKNRSLDLYFQVPIKKHKSEKN